LKVADLHDIDISKIKLANTEQTKGGVEMIYTV
jgi:hypothetical protein